MFYYGRSAEFFFNGGRSEGTSGFEEGDGALETPKRLTCCSKISVTALSADTFINHILMSLFGDDFNCPIKSRTKYIL